MRNEKSQNTSNISLYGSVLRNLISEIKKIEQNINSPPGSFTKHCKLLQKKNINLKTQVMFLK